MLHTRAGREAAPARDPAARRRENPRMHTPTDQSRQSRRAKAAKWDEAEFRWRAGMTFKISSQFSVVSSQLLVLRLPALGSFLAAREKHLLRTENLELHFATNLLAHLAESGFSSLPD